MNRKEANKGKGNETTATKRNEQMANRIWVSVRFGRKAAHLFPFDRRVGDQESKATSLSDLNLKKDGVLLLLLGELIYNGEQETVSGGLNCSVRFH